MTQKNTNTSSVNGLGAVVALVVFIFAVAAFSHWRAQRNADIEYGDPVLAFRLADFGQLPGWTGDDHLGALEVFLRSCEKIAAADPEAPGNPLENHRFSGMLSLGGSVADWQSVCAEAAAVGGSEAQDARAFFERAFTPVQILNQRYAESAPEDYDLSEDGRFTGYFEPEYSASKEPTDTHSAALYARPGDLIEVNLGDFKPALKGQRIAGRLDGSRLRPYPDHAEINSGALAEENEPLAWLDPNDLLFLQIQGSGRLQFEDGGAMRVGYAAQNGHPYTAIGRVLVQRGVMPVEEVSMQSIRQWLDDAAPEDARELREQNASYVFFRELSELSATDGPLGAQGVPLTAGRSLAVDRRYHAMGAPVWVSIRQGDDPVIQKLMIAQDTGGAIRGPVRGDFYWGTGAGAGDRAGEMNAEGEMYVLLPKSIAAQLPEEALH